MIAAERCFPARDGRLSGWNSPLFDGLPVTIVMAEAEGEAQREKLARTQAVFASDHPATFIDFLL
ncbi:hypothetical protein [Porphyrobacter sp. YT40]|uniref:hypothetical protein n=1 Tax=Porphyrobacter sp. YT40 TaxID=2547601 RepID=UPI0011430DD4|nr:hypothetical protein [Porphyrobacter sp. YT40]QDH33683.1 hypothetical protein E2E27_04600 [Porphyrobacter sp. YT40]